MFSGKSGYNFRLAQTLAINDFKQKHARSVFGMLWLVLTPLGMLLVYWAVFSYTLNITWPSKDGNDIGFVLPFFIGYTLYMFLSDVITSSIGLFVSKRNYVKKSPFPLWVLWLANIYRALMQVGVYFCIIIILAVWYDFLTFFGIVLFFCFFLSSIIFVSAISLTLSALGPFFNDFSEVSRILLRVLFYASPIAYPLTMVPVDMRPILWLNPLTNIIESIRNALIFGSLPDMLYYLGFMSLSIMFLLVSLFLFNRAGEAVIDVI